MPGAVIVIDQPTGAGAGTPGLARNDLWQSQQVDLSIGTGGNSNPIWTLLDKPPGSSAALNTPTSLTCSFTPDLVGTYRIQLQVNGGGPGNLQTLIARCRYDNAGTLTQRGWAYPAVGEIAPEANYSLRGWAEPLEVILEDIRANAFSGGGGGGGNQIIFRPSGVAAGNVYVTFAAAHAAAALLDGEVELILDNTFGAVTIPAGIYALEKRIALRGQGIKLVPVSLAVGVDLQECPRLENVAISTAGFGATGFSYASTPSTLVMRRCTATVSALPLITAPAGAFKLYLEEGTELLSASAPILTTPFGTTSTLYLSGASRCNNFSLGGAGDVVVNVLDHESVCRVSQSVSGSFDISPPAVGQLVFDPGGGTDDGFTYDTWAGVMYRASQLPGRVDVHVVGAGPHNIPSGLWDLNRRISLVGPEGRATLELLDGAQVLDPTVLRRINITATAATAPTLITNGAMRLRMEDSSITGSASSTLFLDFSGASASIIDMVDSELNTGGGEIFDFLVGCQLTLRMRGNCDVEQDVFKGAGTLVLEPTDSRNTYSLTQTSHSGTLTRREPRIHQLYLNTALSAVDDGYTYITFASALSRAKLLDGRVEIYCYGTSPISVPAGTHDLEHRIALVGPVSLCTLEMQAGAVLDNAYKFERIRLRSVVGLTADVLSYTSLPNTLLLVDSTMRGVAAGPFFSNGPLDITLQGSSTLEQGAGPLFNVGGIDTVTVLVEGASKIEEDAFTGAGTVIFKLASQQAEYSGIQTGLGTLTVSGANKEKTARYPLIIPFYGVAGTEATSSATYVTIGYVDIDPSIMQDTSVPDNFTRSLTFKALAEVTAAGVTMDIHLLNESNVEVTGSAITSTVVAETQAEKLSAALTVAAAPDITNDRRAYAVQIKRTGGVATDEVICRSAYIEVSYS